MTYTVVYRPSATRQLAQIWMAASDRSAETAAANAIDVELRRDPFAASKSRGGNLRIKIPLALHYEVYEADALVSIHAIWQIN